MKYIRFTKLALVFVTVFLLSISMNIFIHELSHFAVADFFNLNPEMHFNNLADESVTSFFTSDSQIAYVSYSSITPSITGQDALIAIAGPLANLIIGFSALGIFMKKQNKSPLIKMILMLIVIPSFVSFAINILPFAPSDGYYIMSYLLR